MAGRKHYQKGARFEVDLVNRHKALDIPCERNPLSGSTGGSLAGDLRIQPAYGRELVAEAKIRKSGKGFATIEGWMGDHDLIFLRRDRAEPFVIMPWSTYERLISAMKPVDAP